MHIQIGDRIGWVERYNVSNRRWEGDREYEEEHEILVISVNEDKLVVEHRFSGVKHIQVISKTELLKRKLVLR